MTLGLRLGLILRLLVLTLGLLVLRLRLVLGLCWEAGLEALVLLPLVLRFSLSRLGWLLELSEALSGFRALSAIVFRVFVDLRVLAVLTVVFLSVSQSVGRRVVQRRWWDHDTGSLGLESSSAAGSVRDLPLFPALVDIPIFPRDIPIRVLRFNLE